MKNSVGTLINSFLQQRSSKDSGHCAIEVNTLSNLCKIVHDQIIPFGKATGLKTARHRGTLAERERNHTSASFEIVRSIIVRLPNYAFPNNYEVKIRFRA